MNTDICFQVYIKSNVLYANIILSYDSSFKSLYKVYVRQGCITTTVDLQRYVYEKCLHNNCQETGSPLQRTNICLSIHFCLVMLFVGANRFNSIY